MRALARFALVVLTLTLVAAVALIEFPERVRPFLPGSIAILLPAPLPAEKDIKSTHWTDQNWTKADSDWVHYASQGAATLPIPYDWFVALEQPGLTLFASPGLLRDDAYLARIGFIPGEKIVTHGGGAIKPSTGLGWREADNRDGLPVGFARARIEGEGDRIGLTCAACHTGHIEYRGQSIRFDGGPAMVNLNALEKEVFLSIFYTLKVPGRFDRFAGRVLGPSAPAQARDELRAELTKTFDGMIAGVRAGGAIKSAAGQQDTPEGFARLDALNRIGNKVFFEDFGGGPELAANLHATDAPVRFPALWGTPWFDWAEYDASISQPLVRNVGEALGVGARLAPAGKPVYASSAALDNIVWIEDLLRGADPFERARPRFSGLVAPRWPDKFFPGDPAWAIDPAKVAKGRELYAEICASCHLGPPDDPEFDRLHPQAAFWSSPNWRKAPQGTVLALNAYPVSKLGVDPGQAEVLKNRMIDAPKSLPLSPRQDLGEAGSCEAHIPDFPDARLPFGLALMDIVEKVARQWLADHKVPAEDRQKAFGARKNCPGAIAEAVYRARPLDGVWAIAPFLHNGSVPSLDLLLRPAAQRPQQFCLGGRDFDPRLVGFDAKAPCAEGESLFSAVDADGRPVKGNSTSGHSFEDGDGPGVVGRALSDDERSALIAYLKTL